MDEITRLRAELAAYQQAEMPDEPQNCNAATYTAYAKKLRAHAARVTVERNEAKEAQARAEADAIHVRQANENYRKENEILTRKLAEAVAWTDEDKPLPEDAEIHAHHPVINDSYKTYETALRLVGAKRSKGALVDLVNWLLQRAESFERRLAECEKEKK